jgi:hypothetical protein
MYSSSKTKNSFNPLPAVPECIYINNAESNVHDKTSKESMVSDFGLNGGFSSNHNEIHNTIEELTIAIGKNPNNYMSHNITANSVNNPLLAQSSLASAPNVQEITMLHRQQVQVSPPIGIQRQSSNSIDQVSSLASIIPVSNNFWRSFRTSDQPFTRLNSSDSLSEPHLFVPHIHSSHFYLIMNQWRSVAISKGMTLDAISQEESLLLSFLSSHHQLYNLGIIHRYTLVSQWWDTPHILRYDFIFSDLIYIYSFFLNSLAILSAGAHFASSTLSLSINATVTTLTPTTPPNPNNNSADSPPPTLSLHYFEKARKLIHLEAENPSVAGVQAILILSAMAACNFLYIFLHFLVNVSVNKASECSLLLGSIWVWLFEWYILPSHPFIH